MGEPVYAVGGRVGARVAPGAYQPADIYIRPSLRQGVSSQPTRPSAGASGAVGVEERDQETGEPFYANGGSAAAAAAFLSAYQPEDLYLHLGASISGELPPPLSPWAATGPEAFADPLGMDPLMLLPADGPERRLLAAQYAAHFAALSAVYQGIATASSPAHASVDVDQRPPVDGSTLVLQNIPNNYTRQMLVDLIDSRGFKGQYDFVYVPFDFRKGSNLAYMFINFVDLASARKFQRDIEGFCHWEFPSKKKATALESNAQGLAALIDRFRNSEVMHELVPEEYKPLLLERGVRVDFPPPTTPLKPPRFFRRKAAAEESAQAA